MRIRIQPHFLNRMIPVFLLFLTILAFGLLIPRLGFYWDDWAKILVSRLYGLTGYFAYYAEDRPLSAWTHIFFTPLVGEGPLGWHILALLLRWLSGWGMWWTLSRLWPQARRQNFIAAVLFLVYPVFLQQAAAVTFHQQWLQYALFFLSLGTMIAAWQQPGRQSRRFWLLTGLSITAMLLQLSVTEYFVPLELVRPLVLWFALAANAGSGRRRQERLQWSKLRLVVRAWAPYLLILAAYTTWRLFFIQLPGVDPYRANTLFEFLTSPLPTLWKYLSIVLVDELHILVACWDDVFDIALGQTSRFALAAYAVGLLAGIMMGVFLIWIDKYHQRLGLVSRDETEGELQSPYAVDQEALTPVGKRNTGNGCGYWVRQALVLGLAGVLLGPLPAWITGRQVFFDFHSDRYALPAMFGAALLISVIVEWLCQRSVQRAVLTGLIVGCAVTFHIQVSNEYRWIWIEQQRMYWQLTWRAPGLKPSTAIFFETEPIANQGLFSISSALNLLYPQPKAEDPNLLDLDYWVYAIRPRWGHALDSIKTDLGSQFRTLKFSGSTPDSLVLYKNSMVTNCLWVLSADDNENPDLPGLVKAFLPISSLDRILGEPAQAGYPPEELFGPEPKHDWCYLFEKASLANQFEDWPEAARLADEALEKGYLPSTPGSNSPAEWRPFIAGLASAGRWEDAALLTRQVVESNQAYSETYCRLWENKVPLKESSAAILDMKKELGCTW